MESYQTQFIELLVRCEVLRFGDFVLKSGRHSPYFVNAGQLNTGAAMHELGRAYARCIAEAQRPCDVVFGPAYKGIPLAVATAVAFADRGRDMPYCFDRKSAKDHGEGGRLVGATPRDGMNVWIVDDVITSGRSAREAIDLLRTVADVRVAGLVVAVDRQERGRGAGSTLTELSQELDLDVRPIVTIRQVVEYLHGRQIDGQTYVDDERRGAIEAYLSEYGAESGAS